MKIGIILGSGLNKFSEELTSPELIYEDDKTFHKLKVFTGKINQQEIVLFSGRRHFYEGYSVEKVLENIRIAAELGLKLLIITNAAGGINKNFRVSDLMLITSHLYIFNKAIPVRDNMNIYDKKSFGIINNFAKEEKINLRSGSYCCLSGPSYETKSEIKFLSKLGIDAVGMSTIPEILFANRLGIKTLGFSCITNLLSENSNQITTHDEVVEAGNKAFEKFSMLIKKLISNSSQLIS